MNKNKKVGHVGGTEVFLFSFFMPISPRFSAPILTFYIGGLWV